MLGGLSYVWAGLFGPFYVFAKGFTRAAMKMAVYTAIITVIAFAAITGVAVLWAKPASIILGVTAIVVIALTIQSRIAIRIVLIAYLKIGYREGYY